MNYRHIYHAGNFADVIKHLVIFLCIQRLKEKEKGIFYLDAHAGTGLYEFDDWRAKRTREYDGGIKMLMGRELQSPVLQDYMEFLAPWLNEGIYPGSCVQIAKLLRRQDRIVMNELHKEDVETLRNNTYKLNGTRVENRDAYESIRSNVPPPEKRGLVVIDPPFELKSEFETLIEQLDEWHKRWESGTYIIWYPIKKGLPYVQFERAAKESAFENKTCIHFMLKNPPNPEALIGCGLYIFNTPYTLIDQLKALKPELEKALACKLLIT